MGASFLEEQPFWLIWVRDFFWSLSTKPSAYDYAARVMLSKRKMENLSDQYRSSNRLILEQILVNLTPNPLAFLRLINPDASYARNSTQPFPALQDKTVQESPELIKMRGQILSKAFSRYMSTALALVDEEVRDLQISDFQNRWPGMKSQLDETAKALVAARLALYKNFPKDRLGSVDPNMTSLQRELEVRDGVDNFKELERQVVKFERVLVLVCEKIIVDVKKEIEAIAGRKVDILARVDEAKEIYRTVGGFFEKEVQEEVEKDFQQFRDELEERFSPEQFFPPEPFRDVTEGRSLYCGGNVPVPEGMLKDKSLSGSEAS